MTVEEMREIALIAMQNEVRRSDPEGRGNAWAKEVAEAISLLEGLILDNESDN